MKQYIENGYEITKEFDAKEYNNKIYKTLKTLWE